MGGVPAEAVNGEKPAEAEMARDVRELLEDFPRATGRVQDRVVPDFLIGMKCDLIFGMGENQAHPDISDFSSRKNQAHPDISDFCRAQHPDLRMHPDETPSEHPH